MWFFMRPMLTSLLQTVDTAGPLGVQWQHIWNVTPLHRGASCLSRGVAAACSGGLRHHCRRVGRRGWPQRVPSGKTLSTAATVQLECSYSTSTVLYVAVWELANCLRVDLRALTAGQLIVCITLHFSSRSQVTTGQEYRSAFGDPAIFASDHKSQVPTHFLHSLLH